MSLADVDEFAQQLPYVLREQVVGYARSVRDAAPEIIQGAGVSPIPGMIDELVWIAAVKRIHSILSSAFWTINTANMLLREQDAGFPVIGGVDYSMRSSFYRGLRLALQDLEALLSSLNLSDLITLQWADVVKRLANGRPGR
jgi:hypothetical protein